MKNRTDLIRKAVKRLIVEEQGEFKREATNLVVKRVKNSMIVCRKMLKLCWRAAVESMYIDLALYKQSTPKALSGEEWDSLTEEAGKASSHWVEKMEEIGALELVGAK